MTAVLSTITDTFYDAYGERIALLPSAFESSKAVA